MAVSTTSDIAGFFNDIFEEAMVVFRAQNLMANLVTPYTGTGLAPRKQGIRPALETDVVQEGVTVSKAQTWNKSTQMELTPFIRHGQSVVTQSQIDTDPDDAMGSASDELGRTLATDLDTDIANLFSSFSTGLGTANSAITMKIAAAAMAILQNKKVPMPYNYVLHPFHWHYLWVELGQPGANQAFLGEVANEAMRNYRVNEFNGATWYVNPNIAVDDNSDAVSAVFSRVALALDVRQAPSLSVTEKPEIAGYGYQLDLESWYAVGIRRNEAGVKLTADATQPTGA